MSGFNLKARRRELHLTLEQVGDYIGVGKSTVRKWETGMIENMKTDKILLLSEILKVHPLTILGIDENINSDYFKVYFDEKQLFIPKKFINDKDNIHIFINVDDAFNIPKNTYVVTRNNQNLPSNCLVAIKTESSSFKIVDYTKINDNLFIINDGIRDEMFDNMMGDHLEIIGEIIYYILPDNYYINE